MIKGLTHICLVTDNIEGLRDFYEKTLQMSPKNHGDGYSEFVYPGVRISLFSQESRETMAPGSTTGGKNVSMLLEIEVTEVDQEFERIKGLGAKIIKGLTTQPWGNRSFYFSDPSGNIVNFYESLR